MIVSPTRLTCIISPTCDIRIVFSNTFVENAVSSQLISIGMIE